MISFLSLTLNSDWFMHVCLCVFVGTPWAPEERMSRRIVAKE